MSAFECPRESDVVAAVLSQSLENTEFRPGLHQGRQGRADEDDLAAHASGCGVCREAATVARLVHEDAIAARRSLQVPSAGQVWWRAAIRARVDLAQQVERPLAWVHGLAGACAAGLIATAAGVAWPSIERGTAWVAAQSWTVPAPAADTARHAIEALQRGLPLALVATVFVILAPIAIYLAVSDD